MVLGFWDEYFWLPEGVEWKDLKSNATVHYPQAYELRYTVYIGAILLIARIFIESFVFLPVGYYIGWIDKSDGRLIDRIWNHLNFGFAGKSKFKRVAESASRCLFFVMIWIVGGVILLNQPQTYDVDECWRNWPYHQIPNDVWWYYIVETGFYWALLFSTFVFDIRRSDFLQMMSHHAITIVLLWLSFSINFVRVGTLILFSHDAADIFIEFGKLFRYARWETHLNVTFVLCLLTWIATRLIYFPFWIINSIVYKAPELVQKTYRWENLLQRPLVPRLFLVMLLSLVCLHVFWTYVLLRIAYKAIVADGITDDREDSDDSGDEETVKKIEKKEK